MKELQKAHRQIKSEYVGSVFIICNSVNIFKTLYVLDAVYLGRDPAKL